MHGCYPSAWTRARSGVQDRLHLQKELRLVGTAHVKNVGHKLAQQQERAALRSKDEDMEGGALPVTECQGELRFSLTYVRSHKNVYK